MSRVGKLVLAAVVALAVLLGGGYALLAARTADSPAPAAIDASPTPTPGEGAGSAEAGSSATADGTWQVQRGGRSFVGYRVREQLAFLDSPNEAVGRTEAVTGTLRIAGNRVEAARFAADLTQLTSDEPRRDNAIRSRGLESARFPTAGFELTRPVVLSEAPARGRPVSGDAHGRLTVHGVTREATLPLQGRWDGDTLQVAGRLQVRMPDYGIQPPAFGPVVSIDDTATIEVQLVLTRA